MAECNLRGYRKLRSNYQGVLQKGVQETNSANVHSVRINLGECRTRNEMGITLILEPVLTQFSMVVRN